MTASSLPPAQRAALAITRAIDAISAAKSVRKVRKRNARTTPRVVRDTPPPPVVAPQQEILTSVHASWCRRYDIGASRPFNARLAR